MFYDFQIEYTRTYTILRDYVVVSDDYEAIRFILCDQKTGEIVTKLVLMEDVAAEGEWKKTKSSKQSDYIKVTVVEGKEDILIEEVGKVKKRNVFDKEVKVDVKQYRYCLKKRH